MPHSCRSQFHLHTFVSYVDAHLNTFVWYVFFVRRSTHRCKMHVWHKGTMLTRTRGRWPKAVVPEVFEVRYDHVPCLCQLINGGGCNLCLWGSNLRPQAHVNASLDVLHTLLLVDSYLFLSVFCNLILNISTRPLQHTYRLLISIFRDGRLNSILHFN